MVHDRAAFESIGPGWDYYLDRLVAAEAGSDVSALDFAADYFPALQGYYATLLAGPPDGPVVP